MKDQILKSNKQYFMLVLSILITCIFSFAFFVPNTFAAAVACPVTDGGAGDGDSTVDGTITISSSTSWTMPSGAAGDYWNCTFSNITVTGSSTLTLVGDTASGAYPYIQTVDLQIDSGSSISGNGEGCAGSYIEGASPNTTTNVCGDNDGAGFGSAATTGGGGGANGGDGGRGGTTGGGYVTAGSRYGSAFMATPFFGSGGGGSYQWNSLSWGGDGGGSIRLDVSGTFTHNGEITSDGDDGRTSATNRNGGGGSGGSIYVDVGTLAGSTGIFSADGGAGINGGHATADGGGGGGGRVYIEYDSTSYTLTNSEVTVAGGTNNSGFGEVGSGGTGLVYNTATDTLTSFGSWVHTNDNSAEYDNSENWIFDTGVTHTCDTGAATPDIGKQSVGNVTSLTFGGTFSCTETSITNVNFYADTTFALSTGASITVSQRTADIDFTIPNNQTWTNVTVTGPIEGRIFIDDSVSVSLAGTTAINGNVYWENLTGMTIASTASIDASGKGCDSNPNNVSAGAGGPGDGFSDDGTFSCVNSGIGSGIGASGSGGRGAGGGGLGGAGGTGSGTTSSGAGGVTHGSNTAPLRFGSSGGTATKISGGGFQYEGGFGGGLVYVNLASGTFTHNGPIITDGLVGTGGTSDSLASGGGSGGSIYLNLSAVYTGTTGSFSADGADGGDYTAGSTYGGGGGGGRVSVVYSSDSSSFLSGLADSSVAVGGTGPGTAVDGSTGSFYTLASATPPDLTSAVTADNDGDGQIDRIVATFDVDLNASTIAGADFTVAGFTVSSASETSAGVVTIVIAESGSGDSDALPLVSVVGSVESTDGGETTSDSVTATDAAAPAPTVYSYKDTNADGTINRLDVTFSENIAIDECEAGDYTFGGADAGTIAVASCAVSGDDLQLTLSNTPSLDTNLTITLIYTASNGIASSLDDAAGNAVATISGAPVSDAAAPFLRTDGSNSPRYQDVDFNGTVDAVQLVFTESVTVSFTNGDWTETANGLTSFDVTGVTTNSASTIVITAVAATSLTGVNGGTEPTLAFTASGGSISDGTNTLASFSATTVADAAAPAVTGITIEDVDVDGLIEKLTVTWSENVDTDDSVAPVLADFGTITLPDGQAVSSATISDPAGAASTVVLTVVAGQVTKNTGVSSTAINGITGEWTDGTNVTSNPDDNETITDSAVPVFVSAVFKDVTVVDGQVDRVDVTFSETVTLSSYDTTDWSFPENGDMDMDDTNASASGTDIQIVVTANALTTGSSVTPTVLYTNNGNRLQDVSSANAATFGAAQNIDDATAPVLRTDGSSAPTYLDNSGNGTIDQVRLVFSETVTVVYSDGDWTANANGLTSFDTGAYLSGNGTTTILLTATAAANLTGVSGGSEPTLAFTASTGSITDANSLTIASISAKNLTDGAAPVRVSSSYKDTGPNGTIDRFDITFSENIAVDECESGDFTIGGGDAGTFAVSTCAVSTTDLQLTMTGAPANDTSVAVTLAYTAANGIAGSLDDGTPGNAVGDLSASSLTDLAAPFLVSFQYEDTDLDGTIDRVTFNYSESTTLTYDPTDFTVTANNLTNFSLNAGSVTNNGSSAVSVPASADAGLTGVSGATQPTLSWSPSAGSISDGSNSTAAIAEQSGVDAAAMTLVSQNYKDTAADGVIDRVDLTFSETIGLDECDSADYVFTNTDAGTIAVSTCAVSTTDLRLTLSNTPANDTNLALSIAYDASQGTADSLKDAAGVAVGDLTASVLADAAAPIKVSQSYVDTGGIGTVDRLDIVWTEDIGIDECETGDYTLGGADVSGLSISGCATSGTTLQLTLAGASANDTYYVLTLAYTSTATTADSLDDAAGNAVASYTATSLTDGAAPIATSKTYTDNDADGIIDRANITLTETITLDECDAADFVFSGAGAGSVAVVTSTGCSIATNVLTLTLTGAPANTTALALTLAYDASAGTADSLKNEGSVAIGDFSFGALTDSALPFRVSQAYKDVTVVDGTIDRVDVTFTEPMTVATCEVTDYTFGGADAGSLTVGSCTASGNDVRFGVTGGATNDTNETITFAYNKDNETANSLVDASGNVLGTLSAASVSDAAAPRLRTDNGSKASYLDSDSDGQVDQVRLVFTEAVTLTYDDTDWTATANNLTSFDVSALESGTGTTTLILTGTASANLTGVNGATEPTLAFSDATNLTDGTNPLTSISQALTDGAAPVQTAYSYKDINSDGVIDRFDITFSENIDYDECEAGDYSIGGADAGTFAVSACAKSSADLQLTVTGGPTDDTNVTLTLTYDASAGIASSLDDSGSNAVADMNTLTLADGAAPVLVSQLYVDSDADSTIDRFDLTFSEDITYDECESTDYTVGGADAGTIAVASCATSATDLQLTITGAPSGDTTLTLTLAYTSANATANSLDDAANNAVGDLTAASISGASSGSSNDQGFPVTYPTGAFVTLKITNTTDTSTILTQVTPGQTVQVAWTDNGYMTNVDVYYTYENSASLTYIKSVAQTNSTTWTIPEDVSGESVSVRVVNGDSSSYYKTATVSFVSEEEEEEPVDLEIYQQLSKTQSGSAVYALFADSTRRVFIDSNSYLTWEESFTPIEEISDSELSSYTLSGLMLPKGGTLLVKIQSVPKVYYLEPNPDNLYSPILRWVPSEAIATTVFGTNWADYVIDISPVFFTKFTSSSQELSIEEAEEKGIEVSDMKTRFELVE